jgi:BirA family biotin operon repressor/biotin-[acetyl-CoA-carboxylase] ligase
VRADTPHPVEGRVERRIIRMDSVTSTQSVAFELAERGAADGTLVVADTQTAGRGRRGRAWTDVPGESLLCSIVVRPRLALPDLPKLSLAAAVAVAEAIADVTGLPARLKWPNDVLVDGRKIAGILLESRILTNPVVVVGIGVNLRQRRLPEPLAATATSVDLAGGTPVSRDALLQTILEVFDRRREGLERDGFGPVRESWLALADTIGRAVTVGDHAGVAVDLTGGGALVLRGDHGLEHVVAGEVTPARRG